jgi:hypothetical protein
MFVGEMDERHNFRISEEKLPLDKRDIEQIDEIASLIPSFLNGLGRIEQLALIDTKKIRTDKTYSQIRNLLSLGGKYNEILNSPARSPDRKDLFEDLAEEKMAIETEVASDHPICRVDLVRSIEGHLSVAEIEVDKFHGLGYTTFCRMVSQDPVGPGLVSTLAEQSKDKRTALILSDDEKFYRPEANFFANVVNTRGGNLYILDQNKIILDNNSVKMQLEDGEIVQIEQLLGIPELSGEIKIRQTVKTKLMESDVLILSKTSPNLSEKTTMALIHSTDEAMTNILGKTFGEDEISKLRHYIPYTESMSVAHLIRRQELAKEIEENPEKYFVKVKDTSGARGIIPPGNPKEQAQAILGSNYKKVIIQQAIKAEQKIIGFRDVLNGDTGRKYFATRYALFVSGGGRILDLGITSSIGTIAHGGVHSIHMGYKQI